MKTTISIPGRRNSAVPGLHSRLMKYYLMLGSIVAFVWMVIVTNP